MYPGKQTFDLNVLLNLYHSLYQHTMPTINRGLSLFITLRLFALYPK